MDCSTTLAVCHRVPAPAPWAVVDHLVLPPPGQEPADCGTSGCVQPIPADLRLFQDGLAGRPTIAHRPPLDQVAHIRYRWLVGHHTAFAVWHLQARLLAALAEKPAPSVDDVAEVARLFDVYSVLFLYAGSCTAEQYSATVRADMRAADPAFSGQWARDHEPIGPLLHRVRAVHSAELLAPLNRAVTRNHQVHRAVAKKLVPAGSSLLREAGQAGRPPTEAERALEDTFFRVRRDAICRRGFTAQVIRRLALIACDIGGHGPDHPETWTHGADCRYEGTIARIRRESQSLLRELVGWLLVRDAAARIPRQHIPIGARGKDACISRTT